MRFKFIVASIAVATSIAAGAVAGINSASATPMTGKASASTRHAYNAQPNLKVPMLTEDRYIDGHWTGPVTPPNLPNTSGQCVPGIDCE